MVAWTRSASSPAVAATSGSSLNFGSSSRIVAPGPGGNITADRALITTAGKAIIATVLTAGHACRYIAHGTGIMQTEITDTALETKVAADTPAAGTESVVAGGKYRVVGTVTSDAGGTITEVGLFPLVACAANCVYHETFTGIVLGIGDSITYTLDVIAG